MEQSEKEFLPVLQGVKLSKTQSPTTAEETERMKVVLLSPILREEVFALV